MCDLVSKTYVHLHQFIHHQNGGHFVQGNKSWKYILIRLYQNSTESRETLAPFPVEPLHPCSKVIEIIFAMSIDGINFQYIDLKFFVLHDEVFCNYLENIMCVWVYVAASRLCEHSNSVRFEKSAVGTPQHGLRYGNILMLHDIIITNEWFFGYNWHEFCSSNKLSDSSIIYCFLVKYAIWISNMKELLPHPLLCWYATSDAGELRNGNQLILSNAQQHSAIKFLNILI